MRRSVEQILDSTPMLGAAATQDTVTLVRSGVSTLIVAVRTEDDEAGRELQAGLEFDYRKPRQKPDCDWDKEAREALLPRVAQDAERALRAVEACSELLECEAVEEAHILLRELLGQDFDVDEDGLPTFIAALGSAASSPSTRREFSAPGRGPRGLGKRVCGVRAGH